MNAGGTDAAPKMAGPGLRFTALPMIAAGVPTISAEATATTATASATIDKSALRDARGCFGGSVASEKIPRLRGARAARVGGNLEPRRNPGSGGVSRRFKPALTNLCGRPGAARGPLLRSLRAT